MYWQEGIKMSKEIKCLKCGKTKLHQLERDNSKVICQYCGHIF